MNKLWATSWIFNNINIINIPNTDINNNNNSYNFENSNNNNIKLNNNEYIPISNNIIDGKYLIYNIYYKL